MLTYIVSHWRGELSLAKSLLLNGLLGAIVVGAIQIHTNARIEFVDGKISVIDPIPLIGDAATLISTVWAVWATVGIARSGIKTFFRRGTSGPRVAFGVAAMVGLVFVTSPIWGLAILMIGTSLGIVSR